MQKYFSFPDHQLDEHLVLAWFLRKEQDEISTKLLLILLEF